MAAIVHEKQGNLELVIQDYLNLSQNNLHALECIEKVYALCEIAGQKNEKLLFIRDEVRIIFEKCLKAFDKKFQQEAHLTCFVCFNFNERDVGKWLEDVLFPDLDIAGIKPIFCFSDLNSGEDLDRFQKLARTADLAIVACTPDVQRKCKGRDKAPIGMAQEIRMIEGRYNDVDKANKIFPIYLKGTQKQSNPTPYFEPICATKFSLFNEILETSKFNYFSNAFAFFSVLKRISRKESREIRNFFLDSVREILRGHVNESELIQWRAAKEQRVKALLDIIAHPVSQHHQVISEKGDG